MSKTKLHAPTRRRSTKQGTRKSSADRAKLHMTQDHAEALNTTRITLRKEEAEKLRGRFDAFEETLSKLQASMAPNSPRYKLRIMREDEVHQQINWVNEFKGTLVKRRILDVGKKKGKAWADQHRALYLGKHFFVVLLNQLEHFVNKYHPYAADMSREKFLKECLMAVLKKTFSPGHKQAGETPLICDQAVKTGPTRARLEELLPNVDLNDPTKKVTKGRDIVELLEEESFRLENDDTEEDDDDDDDDHDDMRRELDELRSVVSDHSSSSDGSGWNIGLPPPSIPSTSSYNPHQPQQKLIFPSTTTNWPIMFPESVDREKLLERENQRLKQELEMMRRQLVAKEMGMPQPSPYNFGTTTMTLPITPFEVYTQPQQQHQQQQPSDVAMMDVSSQYPQPFSLTPTASQFS